jgi:hypothetical protein
MKRTVRVIRQIVPALVVALVLGALLTQQAGAVKNTPYKTIKARVQIGFDNCKDLGGEQEVEYTFNSAGGLIKAVTTCNGAGKENGETCTLTQTQTTCVPAPIRPAPVSSGFVVGQVHTSDTTFTSTASTVSADVNGNASATLTDPER